MSWLRVFFCLVATLVAHHQVSYATVVGSKHDLAPPGGEPCAYCHTAHHSVGGLGRPAYMSSTMPDITAAYSSYTLNAVIDVDPNSVLENSDVPLCMTCHDGAFVDSMVSAYPASVEWDIINTRLDATPNADLTSTRGLGDMGGNHPVGFAFTAALATSDGELHYPPTNSNIHVTFGPGGNEMWCSSCHNVHDGTHTPFLVDSNDGSALCFACHIK